MILGFKDRFVPYVEEGSKTHTIRAGERWAAGMRADLFARPRQKGMRLLFRAPVTRVEVIEIRELDKYERIWMAIEGVPLASWECENLAWRDGFRLDVERPTRGCFELMMRFWDGRLPFKGQIIHWDYARRSMNRDAWALAGPRHAPFTAPRMYR